MYEKNYFKIKKSAFTLAEVLITLGIIGVVAALTIPSLVQKQQDKATVTALKKVYSVLSQALVTTIAEQGDIRSWGGKTIGNNSEESVNVEYLVKAFKKAKDCGYDSKGCWYDDYVKSLNGTNSSKNIESNSLYYKMVLSDGILLAIAPMDYNIINNPDHIMNSKYIVFYVDINGSKKPNTFAKDVFMFAAYKDNTIKPYGIDEIDFSRNFTSGQGYTIEHVASNWVLLNENLDYLYCDGLNWNTKTKCK